MNPKNGKDKADIVDSYGVSDEDDTASEDSDPPREVGGRGGPDPTRYGDWEKAGRCIDF